MVPRLLAPARAMRSRTCADVIQPCCQHVVKIKKVAHVLIPHHVLTSSVIYY